MSGFVAIEGELNSSIQEYLEYIGFDETSEKFNEECVSKGKSIANVERKDKANQKSNILLNEMVKLFCQGERKEFFRRWLQNIPMSLINEDKNIQKLEFELNIYFAIYPIKKSGTLAKSESEDGMENFKNFIETRGRSLSQNTEFLPYFALPYVPNPQENPGYERIFSEAWFLELQRKLEQFLASSLKIQRQPRLVDIYSNYITRTQSVSSNIEQQLKDSERRTMAYMKKFNKVQTDYHNLIGITAELVDSLENTIRGQPVTSDYLQNICNRLFNTQLKQSIDFSSSFSQRPGTAGDYIRQSLAYQKPTAETDKITYSALDFQKLKHDLSSSNERNCALILQALRWRLTKSPPGVQRDKILELFIYHDLLNLKVSREKLDIIELLRSESEFVREYMARLLNAFASLNKGRGYLASNSGLIKIMEEALKNEKGDTICRQNLLAALQKLSLRRNLQTLMINDDIIAWLIQLLEDTEILSDYTLEYSVALLMNLCLRSTGKKKCTEDYKRTLKILSDLLGNSNHEIRPYVNGALYSILSVPSIREYAKIMNLEEILKAYLNDGTAEIVTQIQFIINQINSSDDLILHDSDDDNEETDDDEEDQDAIETDLDRTEIFKANSNEIFGEQLLIQRYGLSIDSSSSIQSPKQRLGSGMIVEKSLLSRPTTPYQLRQSLFSNTNFTKKDENQKPANESKNYNSVSQSLKISHSKKADAQSSSKVLNIKNSKSYNKKISDNKQSTQINSFDGNSLESDGKKNVRCTSDYKKELNHKSDNEYGPSFLEKGFLSSIEKPNTHSNQYRTSFGYNLTGASTNVSNNLSTNNISNTNSTANSLIPKYSSFEPRPSSSSSSKSRNSSSSGTANASDQIIKKKNSKS